MYCRINQIKYDVSRKDEVIELLESQRETMMGITGIQSVYTIEIAPGELTSIAVYDTKENFAAATPKCDLYLPCFWVSRFFTIFVFRVPGKPSV